MLGAVTLGLMLTESLVGTPNVAGTDKVLPDGGSKLPEEDWLATGGTLTELVGEGAPSIEDWLEEGELAGAPGLELVSPEVGLGLADGDLDA